MPYYYHVKQLPVNLKVLVIGVEFEMFYPILLQMSNVMTGIFHFIIKLAFIALLNLTITIALSKTEGINML